MTDVSIEPVVGEQAPPQMPEPSPPATTATAAPAESVPHTPGGWPVVPLAVTGANATATLLAGAALVGGPVAAALAATGAVVLGATAARTGKTTTKQARQAKAARTGTGSAAKSTGGTRSSAGGTRGTTGRVPTQPKRGTTSTPASGPKSGVRQSSFLTRGKGAARLKPGAGSLRSASTAAATGGRRPGMAKGSPSARAARSAVTPVVQPRGRAGQVRALREQARTVQPSRAARRAESTAARRQVADARRAARSEARSAAAASRGPVGRAVGRAAGRVGTARGAAVGRLRQGRDARTAGRVAERRSQVRRAPARAAARRALRRSAARFQGRRLLAALLAGALGIVGMVTTPLGRWLGWAWLQNPGRRLYARLVHRARTEREARDAEIREQQEMDEAAADAAAEQDGEQIGDTAERPAGVIPTTPTSENTEGESMSGFRFEEHAAEMYAAAHNYEPENAMEILAMVEGLPAALTSVANVMKILAERSDSEFPMEKAVADGFNDIFGALMSAVAVAEDMGPMFRTVHAQDIARHEDPRNGTQAEKGWNV
ncbi:hypothetical protein [Streptomyces sp. NBC_00094]|uniref:hypothetical protein n=1 Tax=Streptomyces sp. NBC_00094 TaxID=2903620 RepID=UPI0022533FDF|nr:hypothetical protein [Streptomyces sp. NBC_00094]MCX5394202.1 hypothetical protein [Streptomyces sp. NBC_00094]